jgi:regulator of nonsense transcripts 2
MKRKVIQSSHLDYRQNQMIENALLVANPPSVILRKSTKERSLLEQYVRFLIYKHLNKNTLADITRALKSLPWNDKETSRIVLKCFLKIWKLSYGNIKCFVECLKGILNLNPEFEVRLVDQLLEMVRVGLEFHNSENFSRRRRLLVIQYIGELYNFRIIPAPLVFETLDTLLVFGNSEKGRETKDMDDSKLNQCLDPPDDCFRIRMVCVLLETCGPSLVHRHQIQKMEKFIMKFSVRFFLIPEIFIFETKVASGN